tara:strand:+ start:251 stop:565 length:315 start_codon:yes stop_codon:yes gene_type:complete
MIIKICRIVLISISFIFLTGFVHLTSLLGPAVTVVSSGNIFKASSQFIVDRHIKETTGKNSLTFVKEEVIKKNKHNDLNKKLKQLVEKRIKITRKKLDFEKFNQ